MHILPKLPEVPESVKAQVNELAAVIFKDLQGQEEINADEILATIYSAYIRGCMDMLESRTELDNGPLTKMKQDMEDYTRAYNAAIKTLRKILPPHSGGHGNDGS